MAELEQSAEVCTQRAMDSDVETDTLMGVRVENGVSAVQTPPVPSSPSVMAAPWASTLTDQQVDSPGSLPAGHERVDAATETGGGTASASPPRVKKTRFVQTAEEQDEKPSAGPVEPGREGGWGWVVITAAALSHAITGGLALSSPVLVKHMVTTFNGTSTIKAAMAVSVSWGSGALLVPLIAAMCIKYGARSVCVLGGFVAGLGALFNSFSEQLVHVFISFSLIFSFGSAMCDQASRMALRSYFRRTQRGKFRVYQSAQYAGLLGWTYLVDRAVEHSGWHRGLQISTVAVAVNFFLGIFLSKPRGPRKGAVGSRKNLENSPFTFKEYFAMKTLKDPCFVRWLVVESIVAFVVRTPLLLMQTDTLAQELHSPMLGTHALMVWGAGALIGCFLWRLSKRWLPASPLLFLREQLILTSVVVMSLGIATSREAYLAVSTGLGLVQGGMLTTITLHSCRLVAPSQRNFADAWCACVRGAAMLIGSALPICLNEVLGQRYPAYIACGVVHAVAVIVLLGFMGTMRERELDLHSGPHLPPRPPILLEVTPAPPPVGTDNNDPEIDPTKLHVVDDSDLANGLDHGGNGGATGSSIVLGYLGDDKVRSADTGDYRWAKIWTGVDAYTGRLLLCRGYDTPEECTEYGHPRKRGYSEPALPVLQECPSQETSSLSRADTSMLSLGFRDGEMGASGSRAEGGNSLVNASYAREADDDSLDDMALLAPPRKMSDSILVKDKVSRGMAVCPTASHGRRLSLDSDTINPLLYGFTSRGTATNEEELRLLENDMTKVSYGTPDLEIPDVTLASADPETLVETSV